MTISAVLRSVSGDIALADPPAVVAPSGRCLLAEPAPRLPSLDLDMLIQKIIAAFEQHSTCFSSVYSSAPGMIVWRSSYPAIREAIAAALGASVK
jgi:hypothetical protein